MARLFTSPLTTILSAPRRKVDYALDIVFADGSNFKWSTTPYAGYDNFLESVSEIRQTLETPVNGVTCAAQNKDGVAGLHLATYWQKWRAATAVLTRLYRNYDNLSAGFTTTEVFRGAVERPDADDLQITVPIISETSSKPGIVANRSLALPCQFVFKDTQTCKYIGSATFCDHRLKSRTGCDGLGNSHHFGGCDHRYPTDPAAPGTTGNSGGSSGLPCPRLDQYVLIRGENNLPQAKMVGFLDESDHLYNPIRNCFYPIKSLTLIENEGIWEVRAGSAKSFSSGSHLIIRNTSDSIGTAAEKLTGGTVLTVSSAGLLKTDKLLLARNTGRRDAVLKIEMDADLPEEKIYACGVNKFKFVVAHNAKSPIII